jgi:hypothetical protein
VGEQLWGWGDGESERISATDNFDIVIKKTYVGGLYVRFDLALLS